MRRHCHEYGVYVAPAESYEQVIAQALAGEPPLPPIACMPCQREATLEAGACIAETTALAAQNGKLFLNCARTSKSFGQCRAAYSAGADQVRRAPELP
ncbi:MAG: hypothetical protein HY901_02255 [Deltaproteobacteria bacterium]|nr:hypothetical protein [Deltaproteobacteria bacterium]